ncbi:head-tail connector protein [Tissierella pigra]|uniref:Phage head-tail connector protein n=1 Tax=Tissierella pigra TaxID=2607614 RepID=A0A6N7XXV4_9FIRM|nr:head-tail connector protein [Tissierella pigra]MSU01404.1 phage head-tail connector protein [Tissierella pigra]
MLELLKGLLNITDTSKDTVLNHHLSKAKKSIQSYLCWSDEEFALNEAKFQTQIVDLAVYYYQNRNNAGVIQQSQGSRSQTFERGIPKEIIQSLPMPRVQIIG